MRPSIVEDLRERGASGEVLRRLTFSHSDDISGETIVREVEASVETKSVVVVDYLQELDHRRSKPPLVEQLQTLSALAASFGSVVVLLAQVQHEFENSGRRVPTCVA